MFGANAPTLCPWHAKSLEHCTVNADLGVKPPQHVLALPFVLSHNASLIHYLVTSNPKSIACQNEYCIFVIGFGGICPIRPPYTDFADSRIFLWNHAP